MTLYLVHPREASAHFNGRLGEREFYFEKIRVFQAGLRPNITAENNGIGLGPFCWFLQDSVMIKRNSWGH